LLAFIDNDLSGKVTDKTVMAINKNYEYGMAHVKSKFEEITEESKKAAVELDFDKVKQYYEGKYLDDMNTLHKQTSEINPAYAERMLKASRESMSSTLLKKAGEIDMTRNSVIAVASQVMSLGTYLSENGKQYKINFLKEVRERPDMNVQDKATAITSILESDVEAHNRAISRLEDKGIPYDSASMVEIVKARDAMILELRKARDLYSKETLEDKDVEPIINAYEKQKSPLLKMDDIDIRGKLSDDKVTPDGKLLSTNLIWDNASSEDRMDFMKTVLSAKLAGTKANHDSISRLIEEAKAISQDVGTMTTTITGRNRMSGGFKEIAKIIADPANRDYVEKNNVKVAQDLYESSMNSVTYEMLVDPSTAKNIKNRFPEMHARAIRKIQELNDPIINAVMQKELVGNISRGKFNRVVEQTKRRVDAIAYSSSKDPMKVAILAGGDRLNNAARELSANFNMKNLQKFYSQYNTSMGDYIFAGNHPDIITGMLDHFIDGNSAEINAISIGFSQYKSFTEHYANTLGKMTPELRVKIIERGILKGNADEKAYYSSALTTDFFTDKNNAAFIGELIGPSTPQTLRTMAESLRNDKELNKDYENILKSVQSYIRSNLSDSMNSPEAMRAVGATVANYILNQRMTGKLSNRDGLENAVNETFKKMYEVREPIQTSSFRGIIRRKVGEDRSQLQNSISKTFEQFNKDLKEQKVGTNLDSLITSADVTSRGETLENFKTKEGRYQFLKNSYKIQLRPLDDSGRDRRVEGVLIDERTGAVIKLRDSKGKAAIYEVQ